MGKIFKFLLVAIAACGLLTVASYGGARATAGKVTGNKPPLSGRTIYFQGWRPPFEGVADLPGKPRAWVIQYDRTQLPRRATRHDLRLADRHPHHDQTAGSRSSH